MSDLSAHIADQFSSAAPRILRSTLIIATRAPWQTAPCFTPLGEKEFNIYDISSRGTFLRGDNNTPHQLQVTRVSEEGLAASLQVPETHTSGKTVLVP